ncbi:MAG: hypothetical protein U5R06_04525 [candidate division KSB1 bacterium]|nr:hypothetical protein [candidate division KSB1 bacterium]
MGQQQLLLIVLSVIIVGIAVVVGINMFNSQAASSNLEAVTNDLLNLAARAQQYYVKPTGMGGGGNSFADLTIQHLTAKTSNDNGTYSLGTVASDQVQIIGIGTMDGDDVAGNCEATVTVYEDSVRTAVGNR